MQSNYLANESEGYNANDRPLNPVHPSPYQQWDRSYPHQTDVALVQNQPPPLPPGWITATDPVSGRIYFANSSTGQTSWEPPSILPPPPPPPPPLLPPPLPQNIPISITHLLNNSSSQKILPTKNINATEITKFTEVALPSTGSLQSAGFFIPAVRATIKSDQIQKQGETLSIKKQQPLEFPEITAGTIADLAHVQSENRAEHFTEEEHKKHYNYEPLKPMELSIASKVPHIEPGRVDIRIMSLMNDLNRV